METVYIVGADCNDNNASIYPGATEICNGVDDNCDGQIDESGYLFVDFQQPINPDGSSIFKAGRTLPVKVEVMGCDSVNVSTATVTISISKITDVELGTEEETRCRGLWKC